MLACVLFSAAPAGAQTARNAKDPESWILVDNDTGSVISAQNEHERLSPASVTKLMTALVVADRLSGNPLIPISANAERMPAMKIDVKAGEQWPRDTLLNAALMASANDAAVALAEGASGSVAQFAQARTDASRKLGLQDSPAFNDPAGFDDAEFGTNGGDLVSARDLAIVSRAVLATPELASIVSRQRFDFLSPSGRSRYVVNHNKMLESYPGMIGMKTGYTNKARHTFSGAATRNGRTMVAVVLDAPDPYSKATELLDLGFATPVTSEPQNDKLALTTLQSVQNTQVAPAVAKSEDKPAVSPAAAVAAVIAVGFVFLRTRARMNRRRRVPVVATT